MSETATEKKKESIGPRTALPLARFSIEEKSAIQASRKNASFSRGSDCSTTFNPLTTQTLAADIDPVERERQRSALRSTDGSKRKSFLAAARAVVSRFNARTVPCGLR